MQLARPNRKADRWWTDNTPDVLALLDATVGRHFLALKELNEKVDRAHVRTASLHEGMLKLQGQQAAVQEVINSGFQQQIAGVQLQQVSMEKAQQELREHQAGQGRQINQAIEANNITQEALSACNLYGTHACRANMREINQKTAYATTYGQQLQILNAFHTTSAAATAGHGRQLEILKQAQATASGNTALLQKELLKLQTEAAERDIFSFPPFSASPAHAISCTS